jgi:C-terminal processing protease CtpA/Prc
MARHDAHDAHRRVTRAVVSEPVVASETQTVQGVKLGVVELASFSPGSHGEVRDGGRTASCTKGVRGLVFDLRPTAAAWSRRRS